MKFTLASLLSKLSKGARPKKPTTQMGSSFAASAQAPVKVSVLEAQPIQAVGLEEERPGMASPVEGGVPSNEAIALEVLQALMDEEEGEVVEVPSLHHKRKQQESFEPATRVEEAPLVVEPLMQPSSPGLEGTEGSKSQAPLAPERSPERAKGPSRSAPLKRRKASKDNRAPPPIFLEEEDKRWKALRGIRANDSIGNLKTAKEYAYNMFTPRDMSFLRAQKHSAERLQEEGMRCLLEEY